MTVVKGLKKVTAVKYCPQGHPFKKIIVADSYRRNSSDRNKSKAVSKSINIVKTSTVALNINLVKYCRTHLLNNISKQVIC